MLYIKIENEIKKESNKVKFLNNIFFYARYKFLKLKEEKTDNGNLIFLPNLEKYTYEKLLKYLKIKGITKVCISDELLKNKNFIYIK